MTDNITEERLKELWGDSPTPEELEDPMAVKLYSCSSKIIQKGSWWKRISRRKNYIPAELFYTSAQAIAEIKRMEIYRDRDGSRWMPVQPIVTEPLIDAIDFHMKQGTSAIHLIGADGKVAKVIKLQ